MSKTAIVQGGENQRAFQNNIQLDPHVANAGNLFFMTGLSAPNGSLTKPLMIGGEKVNGFHVTLSPVVEEGKTVGLDVRAALFDSTEYSKGPYGRTYFCEFKVGYLRDEQETIMEDPLFTETSISQTKDEKRKPGKRGSPWDQLSTRFTEKFGRPTFDAIMQLLPALAQQMTLQPEESWETPKTSRVKSKFYARDWQGPPSIPEVFQSTKDMLTNTRLPEIKPL